MSSRNGSQDNFKRFCLLVCAAVLVAVVGLQFTLMAEPALPLPDLTVNQARLQSSLKIKTEKLKADDCSIVEGCAVAGKRTLLRFDAQILNNGAADLVLGNPENNPLFEFSPCHGHYHFSGFAAYELLDQSATTVVTSRKQAFCLLDSIQIDPAAGPGKFTCDNQGITAGWSDVYGSSLDCQWLDITGVAAGTYTLMVTVNDQLILAESSFENNTATAIVTIKK